MFKTKPYEMVVELEGEDAKAFLDDWVNKKPNKAADALFKRALSLNVEIKR